MQNLNVFYIVLQKELFTNINVIYLTVYDSFITLKPISIGAMCPKLPEISNGFIIDSSQRYFFGDEARVQCHKGFKLIGGSNIIRCGPDQTFLNPPKCEGKLYITTKIILLDVKNIFWVM